MTAVSTGRADSFSLAYEERGSCLPVLFLHGLTFDRTTWRPIIDRLPDRVRAIAIDLPGHGQSGGPARPLHEVAARIHDLACELGVERPIIVGHSMSGGIALIYAATFPTLGVVNVAEPADVRGFARFLGERWPALSGSGFSSTFEMLQRNMGLDKVPEPLRSQILGSQRIVPEVVLGYWAALKNVDPDEMQARIEEDMRRITCPCLAVFGHRLAASDRRYMTDRLKRLEITEWPDSGHFVHLVDADRFTERLRSFIELCAQPGPANWLSRRALHSGRL